MALSERVAAAHREDGVAITPEEQRVLGQIEACMAGSGGSAEPGGAGETADAGE